MSFKAQLEFGSKKYDVLSVSYSFSRDVDHKGRPSSTVYGGTLSVTVESTEDSTVIETMVNSKHKPINGKVTFFKREEDGAKMKEVTWTDGYVIAYSEGLDATGGNPMSISFTVSARQLKVGNADHVNELGRSLFGDYLFAVELAGTLLLVATIAAILIAQEPERRKKVLA